MIEVIVTGGRDFIDKDFLHKKLAELHRERKIVKLIQGGARGADSMAEDWARFMDIPCHTEKAQWDRYGASAGPRRNLKMLLDFPSAVVVAFKGGTGTNHCVKQAEGMGREVLDFRWEESDVR